MRRNMHLNFGATNFDVGYLCGIDTHRNILFCAILNMTFWISLNLAFFNNDLKYWDTIIVIYCKIDNVAL